MKSVQVNVMPHNDKTCIIGIDPGKNGGIATIRLDGSRVYQAQRLAIKDMDIDILGIRKQIALFAPLARCAVLEKVHSMPKQGVASMFSFGRSYGIIEALLVAHDVPVVHVRPQRWQKELFKDRVKDTKDAALKFVKSRYPGIELRASSRAFKPHDGIVDALCLCLWGIDYVDRRRFEKDTLVS